MTGMKGILLEGRGSEREIEQGYVWRRCIMSTWHDWGMPLSGKDLVQHEKFLPNKERVSISLPESPKPCKQNYKEAHFCNQRVCKGAVNVLTHKAVVVH